MMQRDHLGIKEGCSYALTVYILNFLYIRRVLQNFRTNSWEINKESNKIETKKK